MHVKTTILCGIMLLSTALAAQSGLSETRQMSLGTCGGSLRVERNEWQTLIEIQEVKHCPYVIFAQQRQSMQLEEDGTYTQTYVWHEDDEAEQLRVILHDASGRKQQVVTLQRRSDEPIGLERAASVVTR